MVAHAGLFPERRGARAGRTMVWTRADPHAREGDGMTRKKKVLLASTAAVSSWSAEPARPWPAGDDDATTAHRGSRPRAGPDAALAETGGGTVTETEVGDEESLYEVEVTLDNGDQVDVQLDEDFKVVGTKTESGGETTTDLARASARPGPRTTLREVGERPGGVRRTPAPPPPGRRGSRPTRCRGRASRASRPAPARPARRRAAAPPTRCRRRRRAPCRSGWRSRRPPRP